MGKHEKASYYCGMTILSPGTDPTVDGHRIRSTTTATLREYALSTPIPT